MFKTKLEKALVISFGAAAVLLVVGLIIFHNGKSGDDEKKTPTVTESVSPTDTQPETPTATTEPEATVTPGSPTPDNDHILPTEYWTPTITIAPTPTPTVTPYSLQEKPSATPTITPIPMATNTPTPDPNEPTPTSDPLVPTKTPRELDDEHLEQWMADYQKLMDAGYRTQKPSLPEYSYYVKEEETTDLAKGTTQKRTEYVLDVEHQNIVFDDYIYEIGADQYTLHRITYTTNGNEDDATVLWESKPGRWMYDDETVFLDTTVAAFEEQFYGDVETGKYTNEMVHDSWMLDRPMMRTKYYEDYYHKSVELVLTIDFIDNFAYGRDPDESYRVLVYELYITIDKQFPDRLTDEATILLATGQTVCFMDEREIDHNAAMVPQKGEGYGEETDE